MSAAYVRAQNDQAQRDYQAKIALQDQREPFRLAYVGFVARTYPNLNGLSAGYLGNSLIAYHPFFSQYSFASGPQAQAVFDWIAANRLGLDQLGITKVGLSSPEGSEAFFDLAPGVPPVMNSHGRFFY